MTFTLTIAGVNKEVDVTSDIISQVRNNYTPGNTLKQMLARVDYQIVVVFREKHACFLEKEMYFFGEARV